MPKSTASEDLARLVQLVAQHPEGLGVDALTALEPVPRRTLQRRLAALVQARRLDLRGLGRAARYVVASALRPIYAAVPEFAPLYAQEPGADYLPEVYLPTSPESETIKAYVRQPRHLRRPVGFQPRFMGAYQPNVTAYLPPALRDQLHAMGQLPAAQAGNSAPDILARLLVDLPWASSRLEGNAYTRQQAQRLLALGHVADGRDARDAQMIFNHREAIDYLVRDPEHASLTPETVIALHAFLSDGLMADPASVGRLRRRAVEVVSSVYQPIAVPQGVEDVFGTGLRMAASIEDPFEQAFFVLVHVPYLLPFEDVNKPVSRVAANIPFIRHQLCPLSFVDVPQQAYADAMLGVYELNRVELLRDVFVWAYARSCQQYVALPPDLVQPDAFRLRYRQVLGEVVAAMVRQREPATEAAVQARLPADVPEEDKAHLVALVLAEFTALHAGNAVRFGLQPAEVEAWLAQR